MTMRAIFSTVTLAGLVAAAPAMADMQTAVDIARQQPRVLQAVPDNAGNLWIVVLNDSRVDWNGYSKVMCQMVVPQRARIFMVKVVDSNSVHQSKNPRDWKMLGGASCAH